MKPSNVKFIVYNRYSEQMEQVETINFFTNKVKTVPIQDPVKHTRILSDYIKEMKGGIPLDQFSELYQFIGRRDKNEKEICEGHFVRITAGGISTDYYIKSIKNIPGLIRQVAKKKLTIIGHKETHSNLLYNENTEKVVHL